jgi:NAD(P)-dependent dehydrogenase (short-subunit alcohol dehydrogenase family)
MSDGRCAGKVVLVTGAQRGIGRAIALRFAEAGADVALNYLDDKPAAEAAAREITALGRRAVAIAADISRPEDARRLVAAGRPGVIVNLSSGAPYRGSMRATAYMASKLGIVGLTRGMARELAPHGIRVNAVAPGITNTAMPRLGNSEEALAALARSNPTGRLAEPEDIADVVVFLATDAARHLVGQLVHVNGGDYHG